MSPRRPTKWKLDLGSGYALRFTTWRPDRRLKGNRERYAGVPNVERAGAIIRCPHDDPEDAYAGGGITFEIPGHAVFGAGGTHRGPRWTVESWDPLTLSPSIQMHPCGCHGFIREGRWVPA